MKSLLPRKTVSDQFQGRTLVDAVRRARRELGEDAPIRCWKVRNGGVLGFFAHEYYVAGLTPPSSVAQGVPSEQAAQPLDGDTQHDETIEYPFDVALSDGGDALIPALTEIVEAKNDEVTLGAEAATRRAFGEVLAQAEALLMRPSVEPSPITYDRPDRRCNLESGPPSLRIGLADLGVPAEYLPDDGGGFDALWSCLARLPSVAPLSAEPGSVIVVVGSRRDALATVNELVGELGLEARDVIDEESSSDARRRVQRRRRTSRTTVVVVSAPVGASNVADTRTWLERLDATYVIGAVGANSKRADVLRWLDQLGVVDALACWRLGDQASVADLMGVAPICLLNGSPATPMNWMALLVRALGRLER